VNCPRCSSYVVVGWPWCESCLVKLDWPGDGTVLSGKPSAVKDVQRLCELIRIYQPSICAGKPDLDEIDELLGRLER